ncbi:MAG: Ig-like domain-containing protein [Oscillospiraceae bacterium]|jgi:hypothetical protein|nr:Ig-like domain-containing protein [Oscillospiraceae bacterium]
MDNKIVCAYCGTIYSADKGKCPLCGSEAQDFEEDLPQRRRRISDSERKKRRHGAKKKGKFEAEKDVPKKLHVAIVVFLSLAVFVLTYFIGDMLGWWPGLEDFMNSDTRIQEELYQDDDPTCTFLNITPEEIEFTEAGQKKVLIAAINSSCEEPVNFSSSNGEIAFVSEGSQASGQGQKSVTVDITALAPGEAFITVTCGKLSMTCTVTCNFKEEEYVPELSQDDLAFSLPNETARLSVTNLPEDASVIWSSADTAVATVDEDGEVTAVGSGTTQITAEVDGKKIAATVTCDFTSTTEGDYHLTHTDVTIAIGESFNLRLIDSNGERVSGGVYSCDKLSVCSVNGVEITGLSAGIAEVTVSYAGKSYTCIVRVG